MLKDKPPIRGARKFDLQTTNLAQLNVFREELTFAKFHYYFFIFPTLVNGFGDCLKVSAGERG